MAGNENLSVDEVLAACRAADGDGAASAATPPSESAPAEPAEAAPESVPADTPQPAASGKSAPPPSAKMSVEEMLAAARGEKSGGGAPKESAATPAASASPAAAAKKKPGEMSVADMLAAARGEKSKPAAGSDSKAGGAKKPAAAKAAKPAKAKAAGDKAAGLSKAGGPKDTTSILAAARGDAKPGPITKAEAAKRSESAADKPKLTVPPLPEKPAYARPQSAAASVGGEGRRGFLATVAGVFVGSSLAVGFTSLAVTNLLWVLGLARIMFPNILTEPPTQFKVGFPDELAPGQVETKYKAQFGVWVVRSEYDGVPQIYALQSVCTHLGCTPNWLEGEQKFKCPCHGSGFYKDGVNFEGPAPRPLERFAIRVADDGQLEVDKSRKFKEEVGQWSDSSSFVPV